MTLAKIGPPMTNRATPKLLAPLLAIAAMSISPACAQSALGGAKTQQNRLGGAARPAPVIGGAIKPISLPSLPKPPIVGMTKPNALGPGSIANGTPPGQIPTATRPNPSFTPPKNGPVVTSNLKCGAGACTSRVAKP
jgi:hypothetical protein